MSLFQLNTHRLSISDRDYSCDVVTENIITETPVALVYNGISHTVMMCTAQDLPDFALGFSLAERILTDKSELYHLEIQQHCHGIEIQMDISSRRFMALKAKRRTMAGRTGCGICGVEQLEQVAHDCTFFPTSHRLQGIDPRILDGCLTQLEQQQRLAQQTGASHAAAFFDPQGRLLALREDVGRHVALDKLLGWYAKAGKPLGFVFVTSRASFEMVQKCLVCGIEMLCAISATTEMAVRLSRENHFSLLAFTRRGKTTVYSGIERINTANLI